MLIAEVHQQLNTLKSMMLGKALHELLITAAMKSTSFPLGVHQGNVRLVGHGMEHQPSASVNTFNLFIMLPSVFVGVSKT